MPTPPYYRKVNPADQPILYLSMTSPTLPLYGLNEYGETIVAHGYSGDFFLEFDNLSTDDYDAWEDYGYFVPDEGGVLWVDTMAIPANAPHPCTAHAFINFLLDAENGAELTNYNWYGSPNAAAEEFIWPEILEDPAIYPPAEVMERLEFIADLGELNALYEQLFTEARG
jgi:spermidine/putrescine-binding protein